MPLAASKRGACLTKSISIGAAPDFGWKDVVGMRGKGRTGTCASRARACSLAGPRAVHRFFGLCTQTTQRTAAKLRPCLVRHALSSMSMSLASKSVERLRSNAKRGVACRHSKKSPGAARLVGDGCEARLCPCSAALAQPATALMACQYRLVVPWQVPGRRMAPVARMGVGQRPKPC